MVQLQLSSCVGRKQCGCSWPGTTVPSFSECKSSLHGPSSWVSVVVAVADFFFFLFSISNEYDHALWLFRV